MHLSPVIPWGWVGGGGGGRARKGDFVKDRVKVPGFLLLDGDTELSKFKKFPFQEGYHI